MLPAELVITELLPAIVDTLGIGEADAAVDWRLSRVAGPALDSSRTLSESGVRDGDVLLLTRYAMPPPRFGVQELPAVAAETVTAGPSRHCVSAAAAVWTVAVGVAVLAIAAVVPGSAQHPVLLGVAAAGALVAAVVAERLRPDPWSSVTWQLAAVVLAAVFGYRIVPGGPATANVLLGAAAGTATAMLLLRVSTRRSGRLAALAVFGALCTAATGAATVWPIPVDALGAVTAVLGLATLGLAPRVSVALTGSAPPDVDAAERAARGHGALTALVAGASGAVLLGTGLVAVGGLRSAVPWPVVVGFCAATGATAALRSRSHADGWCRAALVASGIGCLTSGVGVLACSSPGQIGAVAAVTAAVGGVALSSVGRTAGGPAAGRVVDAVEYGALTAVIPLACWLAGLFAAVRGWQL